MYPSLYEAVFLLVYNYVDRIGEWVYGTARRYTIGKNTKEKEARNRFSFMEECPTGHSWRRWLRCSLLEEFRRR